MNIDLRELYQEVILDHNRSPRNFRVIHPASYEAEGFNPLCGDKVSVYLTLEDETIADVAFQGEGCAISTASASMMTELVKGKTVAEAQALFDSFHDAIVANGPLPSGPLAVLAGVREFPSRVKCASLPWHALLAAVKGQQQVATE